MSVPSAVEVGTDLPPLRVTLTRASLVRYAGASTDLNPIHWSDRAARALGLPGVIAHGMLTMGTALRVVTDWVGDPGRVVAYRVRFTRPIQVPDDADGVVVEFTGRVTAVEGDMASVSLQAVCDGAKVLGAAVAEVRLG